SVVPAGRNGNSKKSLGRDLKGGIFILPPVSVEKYVAIQRETKARTLLLRSLPEDHMADIHHLDDAREIWLAVNARFDGNEESKKMRKTMLKQVFSEFSMSEEEGLHKGYDSLGLFKIDVKGGSSYGSRSTTIAPTHFAFIGAASTNTKMMYSDPPSYSSSITYTSAPSSSIMEDVLHSFVAENEPTQQLAYEDFEQVDEKARYSAFKISKVKTEEPKAMVSVDSMLNWNEHKAENKTKEAKQVYGLMAGFKSDFVVYASNAAGSVNPAAANESHLIKDCDVYDTVDNFPFVVSKAASIPAGSRNSSASTSAGRSIPAASRNRPSSIHADRSIPSASRNRPASIHAGRHIPAGRINKPTPFLVGRSVPTG
nr:xylulose kinase-1 [Tanacetum cinerariifolium]